MGSDHATEPNSRQSGRADLSAQCTEPQRPKKKLLDTFRDIIRTKPLAISTEKQYVSWARRFILFHNKRHPAEMGKQEVEQFLTSLAVDGDVASSTQNQALAALLMLYRDVLEIKPAVARQRRSCAQAEAVARRIQR